MMLNDLLNMLASVSGCSLHLSVWRPVGDTTGGESNRNTASSRTRAITRAASLCWWRLYRSVFSSASLAARCVACQGVRSHVPVALIGPVLTSPDLLPDPHL